jgi:uncharacterized protein (TIGR02466 family)
MCNAAVEVIGEVSEEVKPQDQLNAMAYFVTPVYTIKKEEFLDDARIVFNENVASIKKEKKKNGNKLENQLYPVVMTGNLLNDVRMSEICKYIAGTAWNILQAQGYMMDDKVTFFTEFWGQEHYKHSSMDEHVHPYGAQIVGFYFIDAPPDSSKIVIHDPRPGKVMSHLPETNMTNVTEASNMINFNPDPGMLFFAPAWLPHSFTRHGSLKPLKFIHFNLAVQMAPQQVCPAPAEVV